MIIFVLIILWFLNIILCRLQNYNNIFFWTWNDILTFSMTHRGTIFGTLIHICSRSMLSLSLLIFPLPVHFLLFSSFTAYLAQAELVWQHPSHPPYLFGTDTPAAQCSLWPVMHKHRQTLYLKSSTNTEV